MSSLSSENQSVGFAEDIKPLFREGDREAMETMFDLWSLEDVAENAGPILERLRDGSMPCDAAWPADRVELFQRWVDEGKQP